VLCWSGAGGLHRLAHLRDQLHGSPASHRVRCQYFVIECPDAFGPHLRRKLLVEAQTSRDAEPASAIWISDERLYGCGEGMTIACWHQDAAAWGDYLRDTTNVGCNVVPPPGKGDSLPQRQAVLDSVLQGGPEGSVPDHGNPKGTLVREETQGVEKGIVPFPGSHHIYYNGKHPAIGHPHLCSEEAGVVGMTCCGRDSIMHGYHLRWSDTRKVDVPSTLSIRYGDCLRDHPLANDQAGATFETT
jgi:hypothetical protein